MGKFNAFVDNYLYENKNSKTKRICAHNNIILYFYSFCITFTSQ